MSKQKTPEKAPEPKLAPEKAPEPTLADLMAAVNGLNQKFDKQVSALEEKITKLEGAAPVEPPKQDQGELAAIASRDPVTIRAFAEEKGKAEDWKEEQTNEYAHELMRVAMNQNAHDPFGDRQTAAQGRVKEVKEHEVIISDKPYRVKVELY
jgi:hypothetical protein